MKQNKDLYNKYHPARLSTGDNLNGNVYIHPTAKVDPTAKIGPHVAIGANVVVHGGLISPQYDVVHKLISIYDIIDNQQIFQVLESKTPWYWTELL